MIVKERTIGELVAAKARKNGERTFLVFDDQAISYQQLDTVSSIVAANLKGLGVKKGDSICIMLPNGINFVYVWLGIIKLGAVEVPINTSHKGDILAYIIKNCGANMIITEDSLVENILKISKEVPELSNLVIQSPVEKGVSELSGLNVYNLTRLFQEEACPVIKTEDEPICESDPFCILYTSGTTGPSKGVVMPHNFAIHVAENMVNVCQYTEKDILYTCLPLFNANAPVASLLAALVADAQIVLGRRFSASTFWAEMRHYRVTAFTAIGSMFPILLKQAPKPEDSENEVRLVFGAAIPEQEYFEKRFNLTILEGYGSTECGIVVFNNFNDRKLGSMGKAHQSHLVRIVDDNDHEVPPNVVGEVVIRPKYPWTMMVGYYKMPEMTEKAFRNLWFHTGDYAYRDEEGFFFFVDRKKDAIRRKGQNISSFEVEMIISKHPEVLECAAVAVPSELAEDEVKIVVVLKPGSSMLPEELIAYCDNNMAFYMVPRYVEFRKELPKTPTERIEKYKLKAEGLTQVTWDRQAAGVRLSRERY